MKIVFSMDGIKNMDLLYTWTQEYSEELGLEGKVVHYHGEDYCRTIIDSLEDWKEKKYDGSRERIANEVFLLTTAEGVQYEVYFAISTYEEKIARLETTIISPDTDEYDYRLERLKIALKNKLVPDWYTCTWLIDEQATNLCKKAFEQAYAIENKLRAFISKVLIHFLGVNWLHRAGFEKEADSVDALKEKFVQRVPEFDNINADFLSMTLETLVGILFKGVVYDENVVLSKQDYRKVMEICNKAKGTDGIANFIKSKRRIEKTIWDDLFLPFIDSPEDFTSAVHDFIENRNHIAHSKVLSWNAYQKIIQDFLKMEKLISRADLKFEHKELSEEVLATLAVEQEEEVDPDYEEAYYRDRLASETGMDILYDDEISDWFDEVLHDLYSSVYQRYHLDVGYEISDFSAPSEGEMVFSITCPVDDELVISICSEYTIDDELGGDSICYIAVKDGKNEECCKAEIHFHNGNGFENEEGIMEADESSEYDTSEMDDFKNEVFAIIDELNPYPAMAESIAYRNKGAIQVVADFPCEECGKFGVSMNEELLPVGKCCYCGWENELVKCARCGELISSEQSENGFCPSCALAIDRQ